MGSKSVTEWMKLRSQYTLFQATVLSANAGNGDEKGGAEGWDWGQTNWHNVENPRWPTLNRDIKSFKRSNHL